MVTTNIASLQDTLQVITTNYTLSGAGTQSGTCTFGTAPTANDRITIYRQTPITQLLDLKENDTFSAEAGEDAVDKLTMILIDLREIASRGVAVSITATTAVPTPDTLSSVTDVFVAKVTGAPTAGGHTFVEQEPIEDSSTWQNLSGGRTGTMYAFNGCNDNLTNKFVLVSQHLDANESTAYRFNPPTTCTV